MKLNVGAKKARKMQIVKAWLWIAPYLVAALLFAAMLWYRGEAIDASAKRATAEAQLSQAMDANKEQSKTIERITALRAQNDKLLVEYTNTLNELQQTTDDVNATIQGLERTNAPVKDYLAIPVPDDLKRVLNGSSRR